MASKWKTLMIAGAIVAGLASIFGILMVIPMKKEYRAYVFRAAFVCVLETIILIGAINVWSHLKHLPAQLKVESVVCQRLWQTIVIIFIVVSQGCYLTIFFTGTEPKIWIFTSYAFLGTFIQLNVCLLTITASRWLLRLIGVLPKPRRVSNSDLDPCAYSKLHRQKAVSSIVSIVYALLIASYGIYQAQQPPLIREVKIPIKGLPEGFDNLRIVQISDIHLGPTVGKSQLQRIVKLVNDLNPGITFSQETVYFIYCHIYSAFSIVQCSNALYKL